MEINQIIYEGIPLYIAKNQGNSPVVIIYHGFLSSSMRQEERTGIISSFYNAGFSVVAVDAVKHGRRKEAEEFSGESYEKQERELFYIVKESSDEFGKITDYIIKNGIGNQNKIYCAGISMGGLISGVALSHERAAGALILSSTLCFKEFAEEICEKKGYILTEEEKLFLENIEPLKSSEIYGKNIFIAAAENDAVIPIKFSREGAEKLINGKKENAVIEFRSYQGGHCDNSEMIQDGIRWLKQLNARG